MDRHRQGNVTPGKRGPRLSKARLDELVEEALVDAYGESEQAAGFYTMLENDLRLPFETEMLGVTVTVESIDITRNRANTSDLQHFLPDGRQNLHQTTGGRRGFPPYVRIHSALVPKLHGTGLKRGAQRRPCW